MSSDAIRRKSYAVTILSSRGINLHACAHRDTANIVFRLLILIISGLWLTPAHGAVDVNSAITGFRRTDFAGEDGAPRDVFALAQARDGYMWIGSDSGLYRFDGLKFVHIPSLPGHTRSRRVLALLATENGDVWVGYFWGGVARVRQGHLEDLNNPHPSGYVEWMADDRHGGVWIVSNGAKPVLTHFDGNRWDDGGGWGIEGGDIRGLVAGADGRIWITTQKGLFTLQPGSRTVRQIGAPLTRTASLSKSRDERIWLIDARGGRVVWSPSPDRKPASFHLPTGAPLLERYRTISLFDTAGGLWIGGITSAYLRFQWNGDGADNSLRPAVDLKDVQLAPIDFSTQPILEDAEGSIWVGSHFGLSRFARSYTVIEKVHRSAMEEPNRDKASRGPGGSLYFLTRYSVLKLVEGSRIRLIRRFSRMILAHCSAMDGTLYVADQDGLWRIGTRSVVHVYRSVNANYTDIQGDAGITQCAVDSSNRIWLSLDRKGVFTLDEATSRLKPFRSQYVEAGHWPWSMTSDRLGRILMIFPFRALIRVDALGHEELIRSGKIDLGLGVFIDTNSRPTYIAGDYGIGRIQRGKLQTITVDRYPALDGVRGAIENGDETWLAARVGVVRVKTKELDAAFDAPGVPLTMTTMNEQDEIPGQVLDLVRRPAGDIWMMTDRAIAAIPSRNRLALEKPLAVAIQQTSVDGVIQGDARSIRLPKGSSRLSIDYAALTFRDQRSVRYRYRLEGFDAQWIDAMDRREAEYTNLPPGHYRFVVMARSAFRPWSQPGASIEVLLPPTFMQTKLFWILCIGAVAALGWAWYAWRVREMSERFRGRLEAQLAERERIARDLHDTLLQGFHGLLLRFHAATGRLLPGEAARNYLEDVLEHAEAVLVEGRNQVGALRTSDAVPDLLTVFGVATSAANPGRLASEVIVEGRIRSLNPIVQEEIGRIGEEAIRNAIAHARASHLSVTLAYDRRGFRLAVQDNGHGIPAAYLEVGAKPGHYGLLGMRERAKRIRANFDVRSNERRGTEIIVQVPGKFAYATVSERSLFARLPWSLR